MAINDIFRLACVGEGAQAQSLVNVFHYKQVSSLVLSTPGEDLVEAWTNDLQTLFLATFSAGASLNMLQVRGITDPTYGFDYDVTGHPVGTAGTGEELPPQDSAVITWRTGLIGRSYRGRTYCWPMSESLQNRGVITAGYQAGLQAFADAAPAIGGGPSAAAWSMVVLSRVHEGEERPVPIGTLVTQGVVRTITNTQRRRKPGVGA